MRIKIYSSNSKKNIVLVRRIELSRRWHLAFGHIEEEEKLRARIAKKEKALTQIEMDIHVQDIG